MKIQIRQVERLNLTAVYAEQNLGGLEYAHLYTS